MKLMERRRNKYIIELFQADSKDIKRVLFPHPGKS